MYKRSLPPSLPTPTYHWLPGPACLRPIHRDTSHATCTPPTDDECKNQSRTGSAQPTKRHAPRSPSSTEVEYTEPSDLSSTDATPSAPHTGVHGTSPFSNANQSRWDEHPEIRAPPEPGQGAVRLMAREPPSLIVSQPTSLSIEPRHSSGTYPAKRGAHLEIIATTAPLHGANGPVAQEALHVPTASTTYTEELPPLPTSEALTSPAPPTTSTNPSLPPFPPPPIWQKKRKARRRR